MKKRMKQRTKDFLTIMPFALIFAGVGLIFQPMVEIEEVLTTKEALYLLEQGIPDEVILNSQTFGDYEMDYEVFPIAIESPLKIDFEQISTMSRKGKGEDIKVVILEQDTSNMLSGEDFSYWTSGMGWDANFFIGDKGNLKMNPHVTLNLKAINSELMHTRFTANISMLFRYPVSLGGGYYDEKMKQLEREVDLFIISEAENELLKDLFPKSQAPLGVRIGFFGIAGIIFFFAVRAYLTTPF